MIYLSHQKWNAGFKDVLEWRKFKYVLLSFPQCFFCSGPPEHYLSTKSEHFLGFKAISERSKLSTFLKYRRSEHLGLSTFLNLARSERSDLSTILGIIHPVLSTTSWILSKITILSNWTLSTGTDWALF